MRKDKIIGAARNNHGFKKPAINKKHTKKLIIYQGIKIIFTTIVVFKEETVFLTKVVNPKTILVIDTGIIKAPKITPANIKPLITEEFILGILANISINAKGN